MTAMNNIIIEQDEPRVLALLHAQRRVYTREKWYLGVQLIVTLSLPILGAIGFWFAPALRDPVALVSVFFGLVDVSLLDPRHRRRRKTAAKFQEEFDCQVLHLRWNEFQVGSKLDPEEVCDLSAQPLDSEAASPLTGWYPHAVAGLPLHMARLICQRTNLTYDGRVRSSYARALMTGLCVAVALLIAAAMATGATVTTLVVSIMMPASAALSWLARESVRQSDAIKLVERLKSEAEKLWSLAMNGAEAQTIEAGSRELQDGIFNHRVSSSLVFDFIYFRKRAGLEQQMNYGADHWLAEYRSRFRAPTDAGSR